MFGFAAPPGPGGRRGALILTGAVVLSALSAGSLAASAASPSATPSTGTFSNLVSPLTRSVNEITPIPSCAPGPVGLLDDGTSLYVADVCNGDTYRYEMGTTQPAPLQKASENGLTDGLALDNGVYYGIAGFNQAVVRSGIYDFDPTTLALKSRIVLAPCHDTRGLGADPATGDLFVTGDCGLFRLTGLGSAHPAIKTLATGNFDGLTVVNNGADVWVADVGNGVDEYSATGALVTKVGVGGNPDGVALASPAAPSSIAGNLFVNCNNGSIVMVNVHAKNAQTIVASGGSRGDFVTVGPDGYLYATQVDRVEQIQPAIFAPVEQPGGSGFPWIILLLILLALVLLLILLLWWRRRRGDQEPTAQPDAQPQAPGAATAGSTGS
jgi:sugar lactone lactonase YvrE